jgi:hypothetical protein
MLSSKWVYPRPREGLTQSSLLSQKKCPAISVLGDELTGQTFAHTRLKLMIPQ